MKKYVLAPDSFKGTLTAEQVCDILQVEIRSVDPAAEVVALPVADGGEGTVDAFEKALSNLKKPVERVTRQVVGPFGELTQASYILFDEKSASFRDPKPITAAVLEMAATAGLPMAKQLAEKRGEETNPAVTTTFGTGQLIADALACGATRIILGLGGSSTTDGGAGVMAALGVRFYDGEGNLFTPVGGNLSEIKRVDMSGLNPLLSQAEIVCMCDVDNPLCGPRGAAEIFGPQKGADPAMVRLLDEGLLHFAKVLEACKAVKPTAKDRPGAGAAGGMGFGLSAIGAKLKSGIETVLDVTGFDRVAKDADCIITGEGRFDSQSVHGKVVSGIGKRAKKMNVPVYVICGMLKNDVTDEDLKSCNIKGIFPATKGHRPFEEIRKNAAADLKTAAVKMLKSL